MAAMVRLALEGFLCSSGAATEACSPGSGGGMDAYPMLAAVFGWQGILQLGGFQGLGLGLAHFCWYLANAWVSGSLRLLIFPSVALVPFNLYIFSEINKISFADQKKKKAF